MAAPGSPRVLLLGSGGQLGRVLQRRLSAVAEVEALSRAELDLADTVAVRAAIQAAAPDLVVNAAAYTAVDKAESEPALCALVNAVAPAAMAEEVERLGGWLVHYSTDYVFDGSGTRPWIESDATGPLNIYGQTKLAGEHGIADSGCNHVILRTSWVYAAEGRNFLHTMLRLGRERERLRVVEDQVGAPTSAGAIAEATLAVVAKLRSATNAGKFSGVYHLACAGETSWCGFARAIFEEFAAQQKPPVVEGILTEAYPTPAKRPSNSRLHCGKYVSEFGFAMPDWREALHEVAAETVGLA